MSVRAWTNTIRWPIDRQEGFQTLSKPLSLSLTHSLGHTSTPPLFHTHMLFLTNLLTHKDTHSISHYHTHTNILPLSNPFLPTLNTIYPRTPVEIEIAWPFLSSMYTQLEPELVSISPTFYEQLCVCRSQKRKKDSQVISIYFALQGSARKKAAHKILVKLIDTWCQFHQHCMQSFYTRRSQKRKKTIKLLVFLALLGSA